MRTFMVIEVYIVSDLIGSKAFILSVSKNQRAASVLDQSGKYTKKVDIKSCMRSMRSACLYAAEITTVCLRPYEETISCING